MNAQWWGDAQPLLVVLGVLSTLIALAGVVRLAQWRLDRDRATNQARSRVARGELNDAELMDVAYATKVGRWWNR